MLKNLGPLDFEEYETKELVSSQYIKRDTNEVMVWYLFGALCLFVGYLALTFEGLFILGIFLLIMSSLCVFFLPYKISNEYTSEKMVQVTVYGPTKKDVLCGDVSADEWEAMDQSQLPVLLGFATKERTEGFRMKGERQPSYEILTLGRTDLKFVHKNNYWAYKGNVWYSDEEFKHDEIHALIDEQLQKRQDKINRAKRLTASGASEDSLSDRSRHISQDVMDRVWRRDEGKCAKCGSNEEIEFDHIIPFSKGGSKTYRNIQLLCGTCNRSKGNREIG